MPEHRASEEANRAVERARLMRLAQIEDYIVDECDPDLRGWNVLTREGRLAGEVTDVIVNPGTMRVRYLEIALDKDTLRLLGPRRVLVPADAARVNEDEELVRLGLTASELIAAPPYHAGSFLPGDEEMLRRRYASRLARWREGLRTGPQLRIAGDIRLHRRADRA